MDKKVIYRQPVLVLITIAVILIVAIIWIATWVIGQPAKIPTRPALTDVEKQQIFQSLRLPSGTPPLTATEKVNLVKLLK